MWCDPSDGDVPRSVGHDRLLTGFWLAVRS